VRLLDGVIEHHALAFDLVAYTAFLFIDGGAQLGFEVAYLFQKLAYLVVHCNPFG